MSYKLRPRLGSAIASTILSLFSGVSLVGVDKAQAAVLTYEFDTFTANRLSYLKVDTSLLTGIGYEGSEYIPISEGRFYSSNSWDGNTVYDDLAGKDALFYQGNFRGLQASVHEEVRETIFYPPEEEPGGPFYLEFYRYRYWTMDSFPEGVFSTRLQAGSEEANVLNGRIGERRYRFSLEEPVVYTLVNTEPSPVPEPLTAGGTALALAGLSWLKHKKKMAA